MSAPDRPSAGATNDGAAATSLRRRDFAVAAALFAATLTVRLAFLLHSQDTAWPHSVPYEGDAPVWAKWASMLAGGQPFEDDLPFRTPGVAFMLRWLGLHAPPFTAAKVIWCVMSAGTPATLYLIVARRFGRLAAAVAAVLTAVSFGSFTLATSLNNEAPYALLVTLTLGATLAWVVVPRTALSVAIGLMNGACMLLRAEHAALLAMLGVWALFAAVRRGARPMRALAQCTLMACVAVLACLPWMLRSHAAAQRFNTASPPVLYDRAQPPWTPGAVAMFEALPGFARAPNFAYLSDLARRGGWAQVDEAAVHDFFERRWGSTPEPLPAWSLVSFKGALDFALSNDLRGDGGFTRVALGDAESPDPAFALARPSHAHLVNHGYEVGWKSIRSDPSRWTRLATEKLRRFVDGATLGLFANDWPHAAPHTRRSIDLSVPDRGDAPAWNALMLALMALGAIVAMRTPGGGALLAVLAYRLLVIVAFYGYARHAVSIAPVLFAFTGLAVQRIAAIAATAVPLRAHAATARHAGLIAAAAAFVAAGVSAWNPPVWFAHPLAAGGRITPAPQWHPDAFEAVDAIVIEPMPASAR